MDLQLKGKTAVVTGGTRGIGRAIADCFADEGANVAICARNAEQVADAVKALEAKGVKAFGQVVDIADGPALQAFITKAGETLGGIDVLVSNASALVQGNGEDAWKAMFEIDMLGAVRTFEAAKPFLEKAAAAHGDAAFIITSSVSAAETDNPNSYGAMKAALIHYAKGVAREGGLAGHCFLRGRRVGQCEGWHADLLRPDDQAQPDRPHGDPGRSGGSDRVSGQPALGVHHRRQPAGGRGNLAAG